MEVREGLLDSLSATQARVDANRKTLGQLSQLSGEVGWTTAELVKDIRARGEALHEIANTCHFHQQLDVRSMKQIRQLQKLNGIQSELTVIHSAFSVNEENVKLDVIIFEESSDTKVLRIAPIRHHTNLTAKPKLMEYKGPGFVLYNRTSNCARGFEVGADLTVCETCHEQD